MGYAGEALLGSTAAHAKRLLLSLPILLIAPCLSGQYITFTASPSGGSGTADIQLMRARVTATTAATYFEMTGWDAGGPGGGYLGIQDGGGSCDEGGTGAKNYVFSLWDAPSGAQSVVVYANPTGVTCRFGGEGTGIHYLNFAMPWQLNFWYQFVVRTWNYNSATYFGFWSFDESAGIWTHHATFAYPAPNTVMTGDESAFFEYFGPNGPPPTIGGHRRAISSPSATVVRTVLPCSCRNASDRIRTVNDLSEGAGE
jgi:hypothetical protein